MNQDLTTGKPSRVLWKFCLPLFGSIIFQQLYNIADSFVAGKFISDNALAAVGNSYEITLIFIAFAFGCNIGCSVVAAQFFGAKDLRSMKTTIYTTLIASAGLCAVLMLVGLLLSRQLLGLINTPDEIMKDSQLYLNIYICGLPFVRSAIPKRRSSSSWLHLSRTSRSISCSSRRSAWAWTALRGQRSCARA